MQSKIFVPVVLAIYALIANAAPAAEADPVPAAEVLPVLAGESLTSPWIVERDIASGLERRENNDVNCKGSALCGSIDPDNCKIAYNKILPQKVYTAGTGTHSGVCHGHCGIFVKGDGCAYTGTLLIQAYNGIRSHGCKQCGTVEESSSGKCLVKMDYVNGCST